MKKFEGIAAEGPTLRLALRAGSRKARDVGHPLKAVLGRVAALTSAAIANPE